MPCYDCDREMVERVLRMLKIPQVDEEGRKRHFFGRGRSSEERSRSRASLVSSSTPNSNSLRSTADQLESVTNASSRPTAAPKTNKRVSLPNNPSDARRAASPAVMPSSYSDVNPPEGRDAHTPSPDDPSFAKRRSRLSRAESTSSKSGCLVQ